MVPDLLELKEKHITANVIGKSESKSSVFYIAQCNGKISFTGNDLSGGGLYDAFEYKAEVRYNNFGGKWQFDDVNSRYLTENVLAVNILL